MSDEIKLLSSPKNFAVVQLLKRRYPGVVFQGDSLHSLVIRLKNLQQLLRNDCIDDLNIELIEICDEMAAVLNHYELVCSEQKIALPYTKNDDDPVGTISTASSHAC